MIQDTFNRIAHKAWELCVYTKIEMAVGAALFTVPAAIMSYQHEGTKLGHIPLAFSDLGSIVTYIENDSDEKVPPLTMFYAATNDLSMQVFEANNAAYRDGNGSDTDFAYELDRRFSARSQADYEIAGHSRSIPDYAADARATLTPLTSAYAALLPVQQALDDAWSSSHIDHYRNVPKTRQVCTTVNERRSCRTEHYTDRVYSYTDHNFRYNKDAGERAAVLLTEFMMEYPDVRIPEELIRATKVSRENYEAIRDSHALANGGEEPTDNEYPILAATWATGSNYERMTPDIYKAHSGVLTMTPAWNDAKDTARSRHYRTSFRTHSGPEQYQVANDALGYVTAFRSNTAPLVAGIDSAATDAPLLQTNVRTFIEATLNHAPGDTDELRAAIMDGARDLYKANYVAGFDVNPAKWYMVGVWGVIGALAGTGLGLGVDQLIAHRLQRRREQDGSAPASRNRPGL